MFYLRAARASIGNKRRYVKKGGSRCDPSKTNKGKEWK
jgi:hypothetical protein